MKKEKRLALLQNSGIVTLIIISLYYLNMLFKNQIALLFDAVNAIVLPFGIALFISFMLNPIIKFLESRFNVKRRWVSIILVFILLTIAVLIVSYIFGAIVYEQASIFLEKDWDNILNSIKDFVQGNTVLMDVFNQIEGYISFDVLSPVLFDLVNVVEGIINVMVVVVLVPVFLVFLLSDKDRVFSGIAEIVPESKRMHIKELAKRSNEVTEKYFNGKFFTMFILGLFFTIVFLIFGFGLEKAIFFGFTLGFLDIIPYLGGVIGIALPILYAFTIADTVLFGNFAFIALILISIVAQFVQGNILQPYVMGKEVDLHPLLVLSSFLFFGALFGVTGVILAIPITGTIKVSLEYYGELKQKKEQENKIEVKA